jgi:hypothetical protein
MILISFFRYKKSWKKVDEHAGVNWRMQRKKKDYFAFEQSAGSRKLACGACNYLEATDEQ